MKTFCIGVLIGSLLSLFLPIVPPFFAVFLLIPVILLTIWQRWLLLTGIGAFFLCWIWQLAAYQQARQFVLQQTMPVTGTIIDSPRHNAEYSQFTLQLDDSAAEGYKLNLTWSLPAQLPQSGERWQFSVRLREVAGVANPGGPNKEANALINAVIAQGSVLNEPAPVLLERQLPLRQRWLAQVQQATTGLASSSILVALTLGEKQFSADLWLGLQHSGLAHLLAISGLHIGLVFGWVVLALRLLPWPVRFLPWRDPLLLLGALLAATAYAWLAGFAIPTLRALTALMILVLVLLQHRVLSHARYWLLLGAVLLLAQPFFAFSKSFWLSFFAVGVIFYVLWQDSGTLTGWRARLRLFFRFHLQLTLWMGVLSLLLFNGSSLLSLLSNILFVPWCSLLAIPVLLLTLLATLLQLPGTIWLWQLTDWLFQPLLWWLNWCASQPAWLALPDLSLLSAVCLMVLLLLWRWRLSGKTLLLLPLLLLPAWRDVTQPDQWQLHLIDVGQGLAVLLQYGDRALLYDAGPRYNSHSATEMQVLPFLRQRGIRQLDYLILSHDDSDHTGDWRLIVQAYPQVTLVTDIAAITAAKRCQQLPGRYLSAKLTMLQTGPGSNKNDSSCVLLINIHNWQILLPGDISSQVELNLLKRYPMLNADILLLPHHGSNSSSHLAFLSRLSPVMALNSASRYNRHQHPARLVQVRLEALGIPLLNTAYTGAITLDIAQNSINYRLYREQRLPFWLQMPKGNAETSVTTR